MTTRTQSPQRGHESSQVRLKATLWCLAGFIATAACALLASVCPVCASEPTPEALTRGILYEQRLGNPVPLALAFTDEQGQRVRLGDYFRGRPVVLAMGYYRCPMLCGPSLNATARTLEEFPPA